MKHVLLLCAVIAIAACTKSGEPTGIADITCPPDSTLTYQNFGQAFFEANCLSCHATKERPTLATQAQIRTNRANILEEAVYTTSMPEDADMDLAERQMLGEWLACGAP